MDSPDADSNCDKQEDHLPITDSWLFKGLKATIGDLPVSEMEPSHEKVASRRRIEVLTEYTWIQIKKDHRMANVLFPAVYAPGQPRIWQGITTTPSAPLTASTEPPVIIDEHPQRQPAFPYEPTFQVLHTQQQQLAAPPSSSSPPTDFRTVDIVSDAPTLAALFTFLTTDAAATTTTTTTTGPPFRLDLSTIRNTLFLTTATHRGRGHTDKGGGGRPLLPPWLAPALTTLVTNPNPLPLSGHHFRVVRYRLGALVVVARAKVDFALDHRAPLPRSEDPPFRRDGGGGCQYKRYHANTTAANDKEEEERDASSSVRVLEFQTLVKHSQGRGTRADATGVTSVRLASWDGAAALAAQMPLLWFGRVPYVLDGVVSRHFEVVAGTKLLSARDSYGAWETQHQGGLRRMAGALRQLQGITRAAGGNCVLIADPGQRSLRLYRPVIKRFLVPQALAVAVWGPDEGLVERVYATSEGRDDDDSTLSLLSDTPSRFSDWKLEAGVIPDTRAGARRLGVDDSRQAVEDWLDNDSTEYKTSEDEDESSSRSPRDRRASTRNRSRQYQLLSGRCGRPSGRGGRPPGRRGRPPLGSSVRGALDGAVEYDEDEEMNDQVMWQEEEEDSHIQEDDAMDGASHSDTTSAFGPPSSQDFSMADDDDDDDDAAAGNPVPSVELDDLGF